MRFYAVAAILLALVLIVGLVYPVTPYVPELAQGPAPDSRAGPTCLDLRFGSPGNGSVQSARLRLEPVFDRYGAHTTWYRAKRVDINGSLDAIWRPTTADSMDIAWHHSPRIRLPSGGAETLVGWAYPILPTSLIGMLFERQTSVVARRIGCAELS
jgi:hypothetical protein